MDTRLLDILVCPLCKGRLYPDRKLDELICRGDQLAFPIRDGIPVMLEQEARILTEHTPDSSHEKSIENLARKAVNPATPLPRGSSD